MKTFLSIKFWGDDRNKEHFEAVAQAIEDAGFKVFCFLRDAEEWGKIKVKPEDLMKDTFTEIDRSQVPIADVGDWPIGVGVEAGYAYAKGIPVVCICPFDKSIANTVASLAKKVIRYNDYQDLRTQLTELIIKHEI